MYVKVSGVLRDLVRRISIAYELHDEGAYIAAYHCVPASSVVVLKIARVKVQSLSGWQEVEDFLARVNFNEF